jgi:hypothetical protein
MFVPDTRLVIGENFVSLCELTNSFTFNQEIWANAKGGQFTTEKFRHDMPGNQANAFEQRSWVSGGWASPCEAQPFTPDSEEKFFQCLTRELNSLFDLGLCTEPIVDRLFKEEQQTRKIQGS